MNKKKLFALILAAAITCGLVSACSNGADGGAIDTGESVTAADETVQTETTVIAPNIKAIDCGGRDYTILNRKVTPNYNGHPYAEFSAEEETGEVLNDAVYKRNLYIEEKYNLNIVSVEAEDVFTEAQKTIMASDASFDLISIGPRYAFTLAINNLLQNINNLPYIDFDKQWWMSYVLESSSVGGKNYFMAGMMNIGMLNTVGITYLNKSLADTFNIKYPYEDVKAGIWTMDNMLSLSRIVTSDLNGDGKFDENDRYGIVCSSFAWQPLYYGTDNLIIKKDQNDLPYFDSGNERMYDTLVKIIEMLNNKETTINVNHLTGYTDLGALTVEIFKTDKALFFIELIYGVPPLRDMESDFGILPMPKYDENQKRYSTYIHTQHSTVMAVPVTNSDNELTGSLLEDFAYKSYELILPTFYDIMLKTKFARDNESAEMLDIIYENISIDIALLMIDSGINVDNILRGACTAGDTSITSKLAANKEAYDKALEKAVEALMK